MTQLRSERALMNTSVSDRRLGNSLDGQDVNFLMVTAAAFPREASRDNRGDRGTRRFRESIHNVECTSDTKSPCSGTTARPSRQPAKILRSSDQRNSIISIRHT